MRTEYERTQQNPESQNSRKNLTAAERKELAQKAAAARWGEAAGRAEVNYAGVGVDGDTRDRRGKIRQAEVIGPPLQHLMPGVVGVATQRGSKPSGAYSLSARSQGGGDRISRVRTGTPASNFCGLNAGERFHLFPKKQAPANYTATGKCNGDSCNVINHLPGRLDFAMSCDFRGSCGDLSQNTEVTITGTKTGQFLRVF